MLYSNGRKREALGCYQFNVYNMKDTQDRLSDRVTDGGRACSGSDDHTVEILSDLAPFSVKDSKAKSERKGVGMFS